MNKQLLSQLNSLSIEELRQLNSVVVSMIKEHKAETAWSIKNKLRVGDNVKVNHHKVHGLVGSVLEINRTRCKVRFLSSTFTVPLSMVEIVK
jgi:transcription antitermination factor NusG